MKRIIYDELKKWKHSKSRKPLMMYGARQVGKTYILKEFGEQEYDSLVYVNCYKNDLVRTLFSGNADIDRILVGLSSISHKTIIPGKTLVFLDEIQEVPPIISTLKYFYENRPDIHVIVAGSLLGVMNMQGESFPVGKVDIMHLYPMSFEEFLDAMGEGQLVDLLHSNDHQLTDVFASKFIDLLRQYYFTGGMPEAVKTYCDTKDLIAVRTIQKNILAAYEADIAKHTASETQRVRMVWQSVPEQLARENKKFIYGAVRKGARAKDFEIAIQWLVDAGLVYKVNRVRDLNVPLRFYSDSNAFKLYLLDIGLLGAMTDAPAKSILIGDSIFIEYKGAFTENYVLQQLKSLPHTFIYYYSNENSTMEIDFVIQHDNEIIPVEVKAEENLRAKSLRQFTKDNPNLHGIRFSMSGHREQEWMTNVPLWAVKWAFD